MAGYIFYKLVRLGFNQKDCYELIKALKIYERNYGSRWLEMLANSWKRDRYPIVDRNQGYLLKIIRSKPGGIEFITSLSGGKIRAEQLPEDKEPLYKRMARGEPFWR